MVEYMKKLIYYLIFMFLMSVGVMGSLMACGNAENNDTYKEKTLSVKDKIDVGDYLFNTDQGDCIEISGKDLLNHKEVNISTAEEDGRDIELVIKRDNYGPGIAMIVFLEKMELI